MSAAARRKKYAPHECGALVLGQTLGERSNFLIPQPASRHVDLCQSAGRLAATFLLAATIVGAAAGCDTWRIKAEGSEKNFDWGVGARF